MSAALPYIGYLVVLVALAVPLGTYMAHVMDGEKCLLSPVLGPVERGVYRLLRIDPAEQMGWRRYLASVLAFSGVGLVVVTVVQMVQNHLPLNPLDLPGVSADLAFNTAASFVTNTNWQAYSGETTLSYLSQFLLLTVQNFVSAATGIAVLFALIRGFRQTGTKGLGSFWVDMVRIVMFVLIPLNLVSSLVLAGGGVIQNLNTYDTATLVEPVAFDAEGTYLPDADVDVESGVVTVDGEVVEDATIVTEQFLPQGPAASQIAVKQSGTNGGGFFGANSAHPYENPSALTNLVEATSLLLIPVALCFTFGRAVGNSRQGVAIFAAMAIMLVAAVAVVGVNEQAATPQLSADGQVALAASAGGDYPGGNMEGKESRFGIDDSSLWAAYTTAASNGSVNSMHDSYTPLGGLALILQMALGEVIFGGVGCGLYGMLGFAILTVFIAGLMVGRTPEFLGKKIEPFEMRMAVLICLATPFGILVGSGIAGLVPEVLGSVHNAGAHGFSEMLYAFVSCGANNGSAFAGFNGNTVLLNVMLGVLMLFVRFLPIFATLAMAGSLARKRLVATSAGTLSTTNGTFVFLLILIVLLIGALSFFPALALGPIAEFFQMIV